MKKILVVGKNSYIGTSFINYMISNYPNEYQFNELDTYGEEWKNFEYSKYDVVYQVAGIAHIKETQENSYLYYKVNRDLAVEIAKLAKNAGVKQFVYLSSMSVYGMTTGVITKNTIPNPTTNYGKSKLQAEKELKKLNDDNFCVTILRPPMVYGKGCKGNFQSLIKIAKALPVFPYVDNERSMIYIDNLSSFVRLAIDEKTDGIFFPQNKNYVNTTEMQKNIALSLNKKIIILKSTYPLVKILRKVVPKANKAFGSLIYKNTEDFEFKYNVVNFEESIKESV